MSFPEALRYLAERYNIEIVEKQLTESQRREKQIADSLFITNQYATDYFHKELMETDEGKSIGLSYFKERGFREETIEHWHLGYTSKQKNSFTLQATQDSHNPDLLKKLGLTTQYGSDFYRERVMFPIRNLSGKIIGFGGRILQKDAKAAKYINSPESDIYNKSRVLFGAYYAKSEIRKLDECILVEGYTDVISLHQSGITNVVASSGTSLTVGQIQLNCHNNNHGQKIKSQPHSESVSNELMLPKGGNSTLVSEIATQTLTNKTLTSPTITGTGTIAGTFTGNVTGDLYGTIRDTNGNLVLDNGSVGGTPSFGGDVNGIIGAGTPKAVTGTIITANTNFVGPLTGNVDGIVGGTTPAAVTGTTGSFTSISTTGNVTMTGKFIKQF